MRSNRFNFKKLRLSGYLSLELAISITIGTMFIIMFSSLSISLTAEKNRLKRMIFLESYYSDEISNLKYLAKNDYSQIKSSARLDEINEIKIEIEVFFLENFLKKVQVSIADLKEKQYINGSIILSDLVNSRYKEACLIDSEKNISGFEVYGEFDLGIDEIPTDILINGEAVYISANSSSTTLADLFVYKKLDNNQFEFVSKYNTGPGVNAISFFNQHIFLANTSSNSQLQIYSVSNTLEPKFISSIKLSDNTEEAFALENYGSIIFIGTAKSETGQEIYAVDVSNPNSPQIVNSYEINSKVSALLIYYGYLFVASADQYHLKVLNINNLLNIFEVGRYSSLGYNVQSGKSLFIWGDELYFGKTVGGFNNLNYKELISFKNIDISNLSSIFSTTSLYFDTGASVNAMAGSGNNIFIALGEPKNKMVLLNSLTASSTTEMILSGVPNSLLCRGEEIYLTTKESTGIKVIKPLYSK